MDKMNSWFIFALAALIIWGFWGFVAKLATEYINPKSVLLGEVIGGIIVGAVMLPIVGFKLETHLRGISLAILAGILAFLGIFAFLFAVSKGKTSIVVTMTAMYPLVVILLSYFILHETITIKQGVGLVLALIAMILFV